MSVITKVLLADDHALVRTGFEVLLNSFDDILVVAVCGSGEEAVELVEERLPDVVLMDIGMPGIGGVEACRRILKKYPDVKIIIVSIYNDGPLPQQLLKPGVKGFVSKGAKVEEMVEAIRQVMLGKRFLSADIAENLAFQQVDDNESPFIRLSQRESEVTDLILQGKSIQEMARILELSDKTINTYCFACMKS